MTVSLPAALRRRTAPSPDIAREELEARAYQSTLELASRGSHSPKRLVAAYRHELKCATYVSARFAKGGDTYLLDRNGVPILEGYTVALTHPIRGHAPMQQRCKTYATTLQALENKKKAAREIEEGIGSGVLDDRGKPKPGNGDTLLGDVATAYLKTKSEATRKTTAGRIGGWLNRRVEYRGGWIEQVCIPVRHLPSAQPFFDELTEKVKSGRRRASGVDRREGQALTAFQKWMANQGYPAAFMDGVTWPRGKPKKLTPLGYGDTLTIEQTARALSREKAEISFGSTKDAAAYWTAGLLVLVLLLTQTGCRISEALGLTWDCVEFDNNRILWRAGLEPDGRTIKPWCKGGVRDDFADGKHRYNIMTPGVQAALLAWRKVWETLPGKQHMPTVLGDTPALWAGGMGGLVFPGRQRRTTDPPALPARKVRRWLYELMAVAGIDQITVHSFRSTFISQWVDQKCSRQRLATHVGHENCVQIDKVYAMWNESMGDEMMDPASWRERNGDQLCRRLGLVAELETAVQPAAAVVADTRPWVSAANLCVEQLRVLDGADPSPAPADCIKLHELLELAEIRLRYASPECDADRADLAAAQARLDVVRSALPRWLPEKG